MAEHQHQHQHQHPSRSRSRRGRGRRSHRSLIIGVSVAGLFVAGEIATITLQTAPRPPLDAAILQPLLPTGSSSNGALTWTNAHDGAEGGPLDLTGKTPAVVAACEGGGAIAITLTDASSLTLDCSTRHTAGPILLDRTAGNPNHAIDVEVSDGNPRYVVELLATST